MPCEVTGARARPDGNFVSQGTYRHFLSHFEKIKMKTLPWSPSGVFIAWKESQENEVGLRRGTSPSECNLPLSFLAYSAHKVGPQSRSPPPSRLMLGKTVSWHNGLEAKPNTLHIPRLCSWLALGLSLRGADRTPSVGRPLWLARGQSSVQVCITSLA